MKKLGDLSVILMFLFIGIAVVIRSITLHLGTITEPQAGFFPFITGSLILLFSIIVLRERLSTEGHNEKSSGDWRRPVLLVLFLFAYLFLLYAAGYIIATFFLSIAILRLMDVRSWKSISSVSFLLAIFSYLIFDRLFGLWLPSGLIAKLF